MTTRADLGAAIKRLRKQELDVSQEDFGAIVGVDWDQSTVSRYERGRIPIEAAEEVAQVLKMQDDDVRNIIRQASPDRTTQAKAPSFGERLDMLEQQVSELLEDMSELRRTPRRGGNKARRGPGPSAH